MKKILALACLTCLFAVPLSAGEEMRIMVTEFSNIGAANDWLGAGIEDSVITDLKKVKDVVVITAKDRKKAVKELAFQLAGLVPEDQVSEVGKIVGANVVLSGSFVIVDDKVRISSRLVSVETAEILCSAKTDGSMKNIFAVQDQIVIGLLNSMTGSKTQAFAPVSLSAEDKAAIANENTSLSAYELYAKGVKLLYVDDTKALAYFEKAMEADNGYIDAMLRAASAARQISDVGKSGTLLGKALPLIQKKYGAKSIQMADLMFDLGSGFILVGKYDTAEQILKESLKTRKELKLTKTVEYARALLNLGNVYQGKQKPAEALKLYEESKSILVELKIFSGFEFVIVSGNIGAIYAMAGKFKEAFALFDQMEAMAKKSGIEKSKIWAQSLGNIGYCYGLKKDNAKALEYNKRGKEILEQLGLTNTPEYKNILKRIEDFSKKP